MQYHFDGFCPGDPALQTKTPKADSQSSKLDVAIVGCGPAGLTLAAQIALIGGLNVRIYEQKSGPLQLGQADGVACRSMEMFEAFGFVERVAKESYWVNETSFWRPDPSSNALKRAERIQDVEDDLSHQHHTILSQARIHDFYLDLMEKSANRLVPDYNRALLAVERAPEGDHPVKLTFECLDQPGTHEVVHAKYVVGCDGARSEVRRALGYELKGEAARQLWGVMDVLAVTDFPDVRLKCAIQSADAGSMLIIPREGGAMIRVYIELDVLRGTERAGDRDVSPELLIEKARAVLSPYAFDVKDVVWWSAYEIGQRVCDQFDDREFQGDGPRIFIAGDACHTHSPKAGQGMNVSIADAFNLGWKLAAVLEDQAKADLLKTYSDERQAKAKELIDFDKDMARLFSEKPKTPEDAALFQQYFQKHGRYTAGVETQYGPGLLIGDNQHQSLASGQIVGKRFHSAPVVRLADAKPMQLAEALIADGRWRLILFADAGGEALLQACSALDGLDEPIRPNHGVCDVLAIFQQHHRDLDLSAMPAFLLPPKGRYGLTDYERIFAPSLNSDTDIFAMRGLDRSRGAMVLVRPDQYVAQVLPLQAVSAYERFMSKICL